MTLKPGLGSLKGIKNDTIRFGTNNFLLTFHSNHGPILHRFQDKWWFQLKIANFFPSPVDLLPPLKGFSLELGIGAGVKKTRMMGLSDGQKRFQIGLAI